MIALVRTAEFVERYPRLFHMTSAHAWPTIQRHGLRSVTAILDLLYYDPDKRAADREPAPTGHGGARGPCDRRVRDPRQPLHLGKLARCLTDMSVGEWLALLNRKVFFWPTEERVQELLAAGEYRARDHLVLVIRTKSLVAIHGPEITLAPINTGAVLYNPPPRGPGDAPAHRRLPVREVAESPRTAQGDRRSGGRLCGDRHREPHRPRRTPAAWATDGMHHHANSGVAERSRPSASVRVSHPRMLRASDARRQRLPQPLSNRQRHDSEGSD